MTANGSVNKFPGVGENAQAFPDMLGFAGLWIGLLNFVVLETQKIKAFEFACMFGDKFGQFGLCSLDGKEEVADFGGEIRGIRKRIDELELAGSIQQGLLFVLTMNIEQAGCQFPQRRYRTWLVVDVNPIAVARRNFASDDDLGTFAVETEAFEFGMDVGLKNGFNDSAIFATANHFRGGF